MSVQRIPVLLSTGLALVSCWVASGQVVYRTGFEAEEPRSYRVDGGPGGTNCVQNQPTGVGPTWETSILHLTRTGYGVEAKGGRDGQCLKIGRQSRFARLFAPEWFYQDETGPQHFTIRLNISFLPMRDVATTCVGFCSTPDDQATGAFWVLQAHRRRDGSHEMALPDHKPLAWKSENWYRLTAEFDQESRRVRIWLMDLAEGKTLVDAHETSFPDHGVDTLHLGTRAADGSHGGLLVDNLVIAWGGPQELDQKGQE
jgi:hypothetical protein